MNKQLVKLSLIFLTIFCLNNSHKLHARVVVDKIDIKSEFCGILTKNDIEITFHNNDSLDNQQGFFRFQAGKNSFVKEMWLEVDGTYKQAENYRRDTGRKIYDKIKGKRIDPALLQVSKNGTYSLQVFPFTAYEYRKVKLELYSTLEYRNDDDKYVWEFQPHCASIPLNLTINTNVPDYTTYCFHDSEMMLDVKQMIKDTLTISYRDKVNLYLSFDRALDPMTISNLDQSYQWTPNPFREIHAHYGIGYNHEEEFHLFLENLIKRSKKQVGEIDIYAPDNQHSLSMGKKYNPDNYNFFQRFKHYLETYRDTKIRINYLQPEKMKRGNSFWLKKLPHDNNAWHYSLYDDNSFYHLLQSVGQKDSKTDYTCGFLNHFTDYQDMISSDFKMQSEGKYLTFNTAKLVIEDNEKALKIRDEELQNQKNNRFRGGQDFEDEVVNFWSLAEKPNLLLAEKKKMQHIIYNLYPEMARNTKTNGKVTLKFVCSATGVPTNIGILQERPKGLGFGEVAAEALKLVRFKPGMQRDAPVSVKMSWPIIFRYNKIDNFQESFFQVFNKNFKIDKLENKMVFIEQNFNADNYKAITYLSKEYFDLLYDHPDLIKYCFSMKSIAFSRVINGDIKYFFISK